MIAVVALWLALAPYPTRPLTTVSPGAVRAMTKQQVCSTRWGLDRRHVTVTMKRAVAANYGVPWAKRSRYEFDHVIPRELGGADLIPNLWPQPWPAARQKDRLENALHRQVCAGKITLEFARHAIATDWIAAYRLYVGGK